MARLKAPRALPLLLLLAAAAAAPACSSLGCHRKQAMPRSQRRALLLLAPGDCACGNAAAHAAACGALSPAAQVAARNRILAACGMGGAPGAGCCAAAVGLDAECMWWV
jgi:hypothetical protein